MEGVAATPSAREKRKEEETLAAERIENQVYHEGKKEEQRMPGNSGEPSVISKNPPVRREKGKKKKRVSVLVKRRCPTNGRPKKGNAAPGLCRSGKGKVVRALQRRLRPPRNDSRKKRKRKDAVEDRLGGNVCSAGRRDPARPKGKDDHPCSLPFAWKSRGSFFCEKGGRGLIPPTRTPSRQKRGVWAVPLPEERTKIAISTEHFYTSFQGKSNR